MKRAKVKLERIIFNADPITLAAIDRLRDAYLASTGATIIHGGRSQAIRWAILEMASRLSVPK